MAQKFNRSTSASTLLERVASSSSTTVFVYDLAEHVGVGKGLKGRDGEGKDSAKVISLQTRAGAGLNIVGNLSDEGTSKEWRGNCILTAYTTPSGLAAMAQSLSYAPPASATNRLVVHVPAITPTGPTLELSPTFAPLAPILSVIPNSFSIILSSSPQEILDIGALAYEVADSHIIHIYDYFGSGRETGNPLSISSSKLKESTTLDGALDRAGYAHFEYVGDPTASEVVVLLNGTLAASIKHVATHLNGLGILSVRVLRPWDEQKLLNSLPATVKTVHVLEEVHTDGVRGMLYMEVFGAFLASDSKRPSVRQVRLVPSVVQGYVNSPASLATFLEGLSSSIHYRPLTNEPLVKKAVFFSTPSSSFVQLPSTILESFLSLSNISVQLLSEKDILSKPGGIVSSRMAFSSTGSKYAPLNNLVPRIPSDINEGQDRSDLLIISDFNLLKTHAILHHLKPDAALLLFTSSTASEIVTSLPVQVLTSVSERGIRLYRIDLQAIAEGCGGAADSDRINLVAGHLAFLRLYLGSEAREAVLSKICAAVCGGLGLDTAKLNAKVWAALEQVDLSHIGEIGEGPQDPAPPLKKFEFNSVDGDAPLEEDPSLPGAYVSSWHSAARHILFRDAYAPPAPTSNGTEIAEEFAQDPALRPEIPDRTFLVTCSVNSRLTPLDYDRNVFHLEFDTKGTGLKYAIGEALGVHGWNDADEVLEFCHWYGVDPDRLVTLPVPSSEGKVHTRTIFQALQQQIDIFGHPPKSFYADLSSHATRREDKMTLYFIGSAEGSSTYKKLSEKDTVTFADVLQKYKSARPSIELLCEMIGDIKPRHYSIASAQSVVGDRVDLLVVTVEWATPSGSPRYGQCTRYLAGLKVGQKVTVSIKPSVMKLPPDNMQPLILAGLGTGAAPFRAFLQHRALLASQGTPVGPLYYYFGSRYRSKEYLYGEEVEAFILDKTITRAGLAFSRDSKKKVYIQHLMTQDSQDLVRMLHSDKGVFYLCGPTWPVPDVYETLVAALGKYNGLGPIEAGEYLEGLKEEERYVLEVY